jgi:omega-hydroxy-beta-dihydromenaquinone-9 sulfotransferase
VGAGSLSLTRPLLQWLQADPAWSTLPLRQRAWLQWQARLGSLNVRLAADAAVTDAAAPSLQAPVLVLGPWRSGTTVMHELLAAATGLTTPRTWQCMNATTFTTLPLGQRAKASAARPMDGLAVDAQSPQEDEFALLTLGVESAYRAFWMPHRLDQLHHTLAAAHWLSDDTWLGPWERFLEGVLHSAPQPRQPLLLKSPNHSFRLAAIQRRWPGTRVVWMLRDGAGVAHSNLKMWRAMFGLHGLTPPVPGALEVFIAQALRACAQALDSATADTAAQTWTLVPQARLRNDAEALVREVHARLQLPDSLDAKALQAAIARMQPGRDDHYAGELSSPLESAARALDDAQQRALSRSCG